VNIDTEPIRGAGSGGKVASNPGAYPNTPEAMSRGRRMFNSGCIQV
jgi:hypothetical protein